MCKYVSTCVSVIYILDLAWWPKCKKKQKKHHTMCHHREAPLVHFQFQFITHPNVSSSQIAL